MAEVNLNKYISKIQKAVEEWLSQENQVLWKAVQQTVDDGLFSQHDIEFQLSVLRENIANGDIREWVNRSELSDRQNAKGQKVLCLHAGNLPLVGFQTALGTILSGADYHGKLSRKDPHLLASFLDEIGKSLPEKKIHYSTDLEKFTNLKADKVIFAGSEESISEVKEKIRELKAAKENAEYIIRTAKFSIAYLEDWNEETKKELIEAMLRYGGKGCRSVAVVVANFGLKKVKEELEKATREFWELNPQHQKPAPDLQYQYAYNAAVEKRQLWLEDFLIQESEELPDTDFTVNWVEGGEEKVRELKTQFGKKVQSVYSAGKKIAGIETEELERAQLPPLWWKPDGVDVVERLIR
ncbi:MAG: hypothetical protein JJ953_13605 [Gracilimonas sp.]|uniref:acyl-CoA reductase n=1 Tax=Gracilimonas TaxID=649462 RepID=UPI001B2EFC17|nr:acyl-CoA reductase [Gracilimonas sp.]MBO6587140.1 hypothetical protein [Gracilimonas sp.]MBO6614372.1 hypothetical protein [Gracilimonas sp.]